MLQLHNSLGYKVNELELINEGGITKLEKLFFNYVISDSSKDQRMLKPWGYSHDLKLSSHRCHYFELTLSKINLLLIKQMIKFRTTNGTN